MTWEKPAFAILHVTFLQTFKSRISIVAETSGTFQELYPEPLCPNKLPGHTQIIQVFKPTVTHKQL